MKKKGQAIFGMSFGTIFSIIIIIAIVVVAFFAMRHFLKINRCTQVGFFYEELGDKVESVWTSGGASDTFVGSLPTSGFLSADITHVCFGDLSKQSSGNALSQKVGSDLEEFYRSTDQEENVFMYPPEETCLPKQNVRCRGDRSDCIQASPEFFCVAVDSSGEIKLDLSLKKGGGGPVTLSPSI